MTFVLYLLFFSAIVSTVVLIELGVLTYAAERDVAERAILLYRDAEAPGRDDDV